MAVASFDKNMLKYVFMPINSVVVLIFLDETMLEL